MKQFLLHDVRLSQYFIIIFSLAVVIEVLLPNTKFDPGALTLFSVNSFLYGFYIAPILSTQKARIEELHRIVRLEANAIFAMVLLVKPLPKTLRNSIQGMFIDYVDSLVKHRSPEASEKLYERLISFCIEYKGSHKDDIDKLLEKLVANQINRTNFTMQRANRVYSNEWVIMLVLFSITAFFVAVMDAGHGLGYQLLAALLLTGLSMLMVILIKFSTLSHKKAKEIWNPYKKLMESHFYRID
ncbi:hypothetical protein JNJ66_01200 [Candidatus Saccharibacteria bacterium]|nr:hypothetical protein [Candidatus Saccharibacteria bacterium]